MTGGWTQAANQKVRYYSSDSPYQYMRRYVESQALACGVTMRQWLDAYRNALEQGAMPAPLRNLFTDSIHQWNEGIEGTVRLIFSSCTAQQVQNQAAAALPRPLRAPARKPEKGLFKDSLNIPKHQPQPLRVTPRTVAMDQPLTREQCMNVAAMRLATTLVGLEELQRAAAMAGCKVAVPRLNFTRLSDEILNLIGEANQSYNTVVASRHGGIC